MKTLKKIFAALTVIAVIVMAGCKKESADAYMAVKMTEARNSGGSSTPPDGMPLVTAVNLDIQSVEVHYSNTAEGNAGWVTLSTKAGVYDLLALQNDVTATLADDTKLPVGHATQLRLILGNNNSVVVGGDVVHKLIVPSTEIKINIDASVPAHAHVDITLDFDADKSIVIEGNGEFKLKPVIQVESIIVTR